MKNPSHPPQKPMTDKRKKILELAMAQLKKTRGQIDPAILSKIRNLIAGNPKLKRKLGVEDDIPQKEAIILEKTKTASKLKQNDVEPIDQAKNMDVIAQLMQLKPSEIENIKAVLLNQKID